MELGACLQALRKQAGLSQTQAAEYLTEQGLPMTQRGISKWERGDTPPPPHRRKLRAGSAAPPPDGRRF